MIIKVEAIVREEKAEDVIAALDHIQVNGVTVTKVEGYGAQRGADNWVKGMKLETKVRPKLFLLLYCIITCLTCTDFLCASYFISKNLSISIVSCVGSFLNGSYC